MNRVNKFTFIFGLVGGSDNFLGKIGAIIDNLSVDGSDNCEGVPGLADPADPGARLLCLGGVAHGALALVSVNTRWTSVAGKKNAESVISDQNFVFSNVDLFI